MKKYFWTFYLIIVVGFIGLCSNVIAQLPMFAGGGGAPTDAHYLVDLANGTLTAEVVVSANGKALVTAADLDSNVTSARSFLQPDPYCVTPADV